jgi:hypothetical protein
MFWSTFKRNLKRYAKATKSKKKTNPWRFYVKKYLAFFTDQTYIKLSKNKLAPKVKETGH